MQELLNPSEQSRCGCPRLLWPVIPARSRPRSSRYFRGRRSGGHVRGLFDHFRFDDVVVAHSNFPKPLRHFVFAIQLAGVPGFEPGLSVLETDVLAVDTIPLDNILIADFQLSIESSTRRGITNRQSQMLFGLLMRCVLTTAAAELAEFQTLSRRLFVLRRYVIATLAITALQHNIVTRHNLKILFLISDF